MNKGIFVSEHQNLSSAWADTFLQLMDKGITELTPKIITVKDFNNQDAVENPELRQLLEKHLKNFKHHSCETVAGTIFPVSLWNPAPPNNAQLLFERYGKIWPRVQKGDHENKLGVYFRRMTAYHPKDSLNKPINQLQHIIDTYNGEASRQGTHRRSALQAAIFDPTHDHSKSRMQGFPCLQQVAFAKVGDDGLAVTAFYPMQYVFDRAYGNYLGLCRLGKFMAAQMGLRMVQMTCFAGVAQLGSNKDKHKQITKTDLRPLENDVRALIERGIK